MSWVLSAQFASYGCHVKLCSWGQLHRTPGSTDGYRGMTAKFRELDDNLTENFVSFDGRVVAPLINQTRGNPVGCISPIKRSDLTCQRALIITAKFRFRVVWLLKRLAHCVCILKVSGSYTGELLAWKRFIIVFSLWFKYKIIFTWWWVLCVCVCS